MLLIVAAQKTVRMRHLPSNYSRTGRCCCIRLRTRPKKRKMTKIKGIIPIGYTISLPFKKQTKVHKSKDMESEDADQFIICEFKGYDFEILAN